MLLRNSPSRYGLIAMLLHWVMAVLIIGMLIAGLYMVRLPIGLQKLRWYGWHKEFGTFILMLVFLRLGWRLSNAAPVLPTTLAWIKRVTAHLVHYALYGLMIVMPLSGWMMSSAAGLPVSFFGLFVLPDIIAPDKNVQALLKVVHEWLGYGLIAVICLHASAALQHHFYHKDDILRRMLP